MSERRSFLQYQQQMNFIIFLLPGLNLYTDEARAHNAYAILESVQYSSMFHASHWQLPDQPQDLTLLYVLFLLKVFLDAVTQTTKLPPELYTRVIVLNNKSVNEPENITRESITVIWPSLRNPPLSARFGKAPLITSPEARGDHLPPSPLPR